MNIVTKADTKKFIALLKAGLIEGRQKDMSIYTSATMFDGTDVPKSYYVSIELRYHVDPSVINDLLDKDNFDDELKDLLGSM